MSIQAGLVGLPNVGKSTLFNALTKSSVPAENYPFCTIDPHMAITEVPDERLEKMALIYGSKKIIPATVNFVDIAGLVKGAASGEGLGNQFLSHIREVDLILHVLRCFEDSEIIHSGDTIDPLEDYEIIISELILKDLESIDKRHTKIAHLYKAAANKPKEKKLLDDEKSLLDAVYQELDTMNAAKARELLINSTVKTISLISTKKFMIIANLAEAELEDDAYENNKHYQALVKKFGQEKVVAVSAKVEHELSQLNDEDAQEMMGMLGIKERSLDNIIKKTYNNLGLITFFTCGPKEAHAWPIPNGMTIREAAGEIHSDLQRGFICSDIFNCKDIFQHGSEQVLKTVGKVRTEGQYYVVQDGDVVHVKFNV